MFLNLFTLLVVVALIIHSIDITVQCELSAFRACYFFRRINWSILPTAAFINFLWRRLNTLAIAPDADRVYTSVCLCPCRHKQIIHHSAEEEVIAARTPHPPPLPPACWQSTHHLAATRNNLGAIVYSMNANDAQQASLCLPFSILKSMCRAWHWHWHQQPPPPPPPTSMRTWINTKLP